MAEILDYEKRLLEAAKATMAASTLLTGIPVRKEFDLTDSADVDSFIGLNCQPMVEFENNSGALQQTNLKVTITTKRSSDQNRDLFFQLIGKIRGLLFDDTFFNDVNTFLGDFVELIDLVVLTGEDKTDDNYNIAELTVSKLFSMKP